MASSWFPERFKVRRLLRPDMVFGMSASVIRLLLSTRCVRPDSEARHSGTETSLLWERSSLVRPVKRARLAGRSEMKLLGAEMLVTTS